MYDLQADISLIQRRYLRLGNKRQKRDLSMQSPKSLFLLWAHGNTLNALTSCIIVFIYMLCLAVTPKVTPIFPC